MSSRPPKHRVAALVTVLFVATVVPPMGTATAGPSASFAQNVVHEERGDVAAITVKASQSATVNIGSREKGFWLQLRVGKGTTKIRINTYKAGQRLKYPISEMVWAEKGGLKSRTLKTPPIKKPLAIAHYEMNVTINGAERAIGALSVEPRSTNEITARIAPRSKDLSELETLADAKKATVPPVNSSVAHEDKILVSVNATGLGGAFAESRLDGSGDAGLLVEFVQQDPKMNTEPNRFTGASIQRVVQTDDQEGFFFVVDTSDYDIQPGESYRISFVVPEDSPLADSREEVSTTIRVLKRRVSVNRTGPENSIVVDGKTKITGTTTLTPGTTINISARDDGLEPFLFPKTVTVDKDRTFSVTFDFSGIEPGREFEIRLPDQKRVIPAAVLDETTITTTTTPPTTTVNTTTTTTTPVTTTTPPVNVTTVVNTTTPPTTNTTKTTADGLTQVGDGTERPLTQQTRTGGSSDGKNGGPVPGFDAAASLVGLLAAILLAVRRR